MNPFAALHELPTVLQRTAVRDLAWVITSPPLLADAGWRQRHPLSASRWARDPELLFDWLQQLDQNSQALDHWLSRSSNRRLGLYYEHLWQFALHAAPDVELLTANLPIRQAGHTLGELDLLIRDSEGDHHLELAIKLYLGTETQHGEQLANWIGPGSRDRLDLKLNHLRQHQLPLSATDAGQNVLQALHIEPAPAELWLSGYLFYPWPQGCQPPLGAHPQHLHGQWLHRRNWTAFIAQDAESRWQVLQRQEWLAPTHAGYQQSWSCDQLLLWLDQREASTPAILLARLTEHAPGDWRETQRVFWVDDSWPSA